MCCKRHNNYHQKLLFVTITSALKQFHYRIRRSGSTVGSTFVPPPPRTRRTQIAAPSRRVKTRKIDPRYERASGKPWEQKVVSDDTHPTADPAHLGLRTTILLSTIRPFPEKAASRRIASLRQGDNSVLQPGETRRNDPPLRQSFW